MYFIMRLRELPTLYGIRKQYFLLGFKRINDSIRNKIFYVFYKDVTRITDSIRNKKKSYAFIINMSIKGDLMSTKAICLQHINAISADNGYMYVFYDFTRINDHICYA